ncbi:MAG TPA: DUF4249 family protein [Leadbetterella sp.]|nr:DUF4249 family protein [Leadbetterella sp.]
MKKLKTKILYFAVGLSFLACVEPFDLEVITSQNILIVDGTLDDSNKDQYINLKKFIPSETGNVRYASETGAKVVIIKDGKEEINCTYKDNGFYYLPLGFKATVGSKYKLKITLVNGNQYESTEEEMRSTPEINGYTVKFDPQGITLGTNKIASHTIYLSTKDNAAVGDNFLWSWRLFEKQSVCKTCVGGIFLTSPAPLGRCTVVPDLATVEYDYRCQGNCWEIINSQDLNVMSDVFSQGKEIKDRLITKVPYYQDTGFLIEIKQQNVSASAFQYLKILTNQSQNNGSLVDAPPAPLIGNLRNINDNKETVGGYFMVGNAKIQRIWVDRLDAVGTPIYPLNGRLPNYEPSSPDGSRPPNAPCVISNTRTPLKPEGWPL